MCSLLRKAFTRRKELTAEDTPKEYPQGRKLFSQVKELESTCSAAQAALLTWTYRRRPESRGSAVPQEPVAAALNFALSKCVQDVSALLEHFYQVKGKVIWYGDSKHVCAFW